MCWGALLCGEDTCYVPGSLKIHGENLFVWSQAPAGGPQADKQARKEGRPLFVTCKHAFKFSQTHLSIFISFFLNQSIN